MSRDNPGQPPYTPEEEAELGQRFGVSGDDLVFEDDDRFEEVGDGSRAESEPEDGEE